MNKSTQVISFRLGDEELKALQSHQQSWESLNQVAQRLLKIALGFDAPNASADSMSTDVYKLKIEMSAYLEFLVNDRFAKIQDSSPQPDNSALADLEAEIEHLSKVLVANIPTTGELDGLKESIHQQHLAISGLGKRLATLETKLDVQPPQLFELPIPTPDSLDKEEITEAASPKSRRTSASKRSAVGGSASLREASPTLSPQPEFPTIPAVDSLDETEIAIAVSPKSRRNSSKKQQRESPTISAADSLDETEIAIAASPKSRRTSTKKPQPESLTISAADSLDETAICASQQRFAIAVSPKSRRTSTKKQQPESPTIPAADSLDETEIAASPKSRRTSTKKQVTGSVAPEKQPESSTIPAPNSIDQEKIAKARSQILENLKVGIQSPKYKAVAKALDIFSKELCEQDLTNALDLEGIRSTVLKSLTTGRKSSRLAPNSPEYKAVTKAINDFISITRASF
jgi:hypothetical protein